MNGMRFNVGDQPALLRLELTCAAQLNARDVLKRLAMQTGGVATVISEHRAGRLTVRYVVQLQPRSLDDACEFIQSLAEVAEVAFVPRERTRRVHPAPTAVALRA